MLEFPAFLACMMARRNESQVHERNVGQERNEGEEDGEKREGVEKN